MNKTFFLVAALLAAPLALASDNPLPKNYCEDPSEWGTHYYVAGSTVHVKDADGNTIRRNGVTSLQDGNITGDCNADTIPADYDGHLEWGLGGAILTVAVETVAGCASETPHHTDGTVHVDDRVLGSGVVFSVASDHTDATTDPLNPVPGCDNIVDSRVKCFGWCDPAFPPGADGAYIVFINAPAVKGHVFTT